MRFVGADALIGPSPPQRLASPERQRSGGAVLNDSPVGCQTRAVTEPQRDGGICEANDGEVFKTATFKPLSRARKERAPGIPRGMMRGKSPSVTAPSW